MSQFGNDYSKVYDILYKKKNYIKEFNLIHNKIKKYKKDSKSILELGCGTGQYSKLLAKKKYSVIAVDRSLSMLKLAKKKCKNIKGLKFIKKDLLKFSYPKKFDVVTSLFDVVSYINNKNGLSNFFNNSRKNLKDKGILIFDFWNKKGVLKLKPENRFKIFNYKNLEIFKLNSPNWYKNQNLISVNTKLFILNKKTKKFIKINENHLMKYFDLKKIKYELKKNNFKFLEWVEISKNKKKLDNCWSILVIAKKIS